MTKPLATVISRGLGGELRVLREARNMSVRVVAEMLGWQGSKVSRMETGKQGIRIEDVASLCVVYGVTGNERRRLLAMAERSGEPGWWEIMAGLSRESRILIRLETEVTSIVDFEPLLIPGLLQTAEYIRALMKSGGLPDVDAEARIAARLGRQAILSRDKPPELHAIVDEIVLRRVLGSGAVMARQLHHLADMADRSNVTLRVLPFSVGGHTGLDGAFAILSFARNKPVVYLDHKISGLFLEEQDQVGVFQREVDRLTEVALSPAKSLDLVAQVATEHSRG